MPTTLIKSRQKAYQHQSGYCFYCHKPMWSENPEVFANRFNLTKRQVKLYQCTAEHLVPRQDGGKDNSDNIVAACKFCNQQRHRLKVAPNPHIFQVLVSKRVAQKRWPTAKLLQMH